MRCELAFDVVAVQIDESKQPDGPGGRIKRGVREAVHGSRGEMENRKLWRQREMRGVKVAPSSRLSTPNANSGPPNWATGRPGSASSTIA